MLNLSYVVYLSRFTNRYGILAVDDYAKAEMYAAHFGGQIFQSLVEARDYVVSKGQVINLPGQPKRVSFCEA